MGALMSQPQAAGSFWQGILTQIRDRVTEQQFDTWFKTVEPTSCSEDAIELTVPNSFSREWLRKKYADLILGAVASTNGGRRPTLRITVREGGDGEADSGPARTAIGETSSDDCPTSLEDQAQALLMEGAQASRPRSPAPASAADAARGAWLNPEYRFDTFVVGAGNRLPYAAAMAVSEKDLRIHNPLFLHGGVGLGKSHLLQAICAAWRARRPSSRVRYVPCEQFINQFISGVEKGDLEAFRKRHREVELLVVDDVQFLAGKERTQEEFFHTFNALHQRQQQIVVSADVSPREIPGLSERLVSRLRWGMVCEVEAPGYEARLDIVRQRADRLGQELPEDVCAFVSESVRTNVRELEGALHRIIASANFTGRNINTELAREALRDLLVFQERQITIQNIQKVVAEYFKMRVSDLHSKRRNRQITRPRQIAMALAKELTTMSLPEIGDAFGGRDHTTVLHAHRKIAELVKTDSKISEDYQNLYRLLGG